MSHKKIFTANADYDEYNIQKGDKLEMVSIGSGSKFEVLNVRTNKYIKLSIKDFIKMFK